MISKTAIASVVLILLLGAGCRGPTARSERSFDEIQALARGKTAAQILHLLGEPDSREVVFDADERWIWWNYTFLDGNDCPPEMRGRVVHLEIVIRNPERTGTIRSPYSKWQVDDAFGITYRAPFTDD
jgi:hypothetical protein